MTITTIALQLLAGMIIGFIIGMTGIGGGVLVANPDPAVWAASFNGSGYGQSLLAAY